MLDTFLPKSNQNGIISRNKNVPRFLLLYQICFNAIFKHFVKGILTIIHNCKVMYKCIFTIDSENAISFRIRIRAAP